MELTKVKNYLEIATNVAVLLVAIVVLSVFARSLIAPKPAIQVQTGLEKGQSLTQLPLVDYGSSRQTLVIAISPKCDFCSQSVPFYKQLEQIGRETNNPTQIVAVFPDKAEEVSRFTAEKQLNIQAVPDVDFKALNLTGAPAMILVDSHGKIIDFWLGKLSEERQQQIIRSISDPVAVSLCQREK